MTTPIEILGKIGARFDSSEAFDKALDVLTIELFELKKINNIDTNLLYHKVLAWAKDRHLLVPNKTQSRENAFKQCVKLMEEVGELANAIIRGEEEPLIDAFGDVQVVLMILSAQLYVDYNHALDVAWNTIKRRKGVSKNGLFIKDGL